MRILRHWFFALCSIGWLVPFVLAWGSVLSYLNDDLARLHLTGARALQPSSLVINEALNITNAREMLYLSAAWLALVILGWCFYAFERSRAVAAPVLSTPEPVAPAAGAVPQAVIIEEMLASRMQFLDARLEEMTQLLHKSGKTMDTQLDDLRGQIIQVQAAGNSSKFGELATASLAANDTKRLHQVVLNLADLQADLRMLRRQQRSNG